MKIRQRPIAKLGVGLMITATTAQATNPTSLTDGFVLDMGTIDKFVQPIVLDTAFDVAVLVFLGARETMT